MSQTMNQTPASSKKKSTAKFPVEEPVELTGSEKFFEAIKPHLATIGLVCVAGLLGFAAVAIFVKSNFTKEAEQWRELSFASSIALGSGNLAPLKEVTENYGETKASMWAVQMVGDQQLTTGLDQMLRDREVGKQQVEKAKENFKRVVEAPASAKTTMLDRRAHFSLAYAYESLGQFDKAKTIYDELVEQAPESPFASPAKRGSKRSSDPAYAKLYEKFVNFEEAVIGDAPGPLVPDSPNLTTPDFEGIDSTEEKPQAPAAETTDNDFQPAKKAEEKVDAAESSETAAPETAAPEKTESESTEPKVEAAEAASTETKSDEKEKK